MPIEIDRIRELIPHSGKMCLLERVLDYSTQSIRCETRSHLDQANPLRRNGHLSSICGIEYAAQAMALHGSLRSPERSTASVSAPDVEPERRSKPNRPRHGYLVNVRETHCHTRYLDEFSTALDVSAEFVFGDASGMIYTFVVTAGETSLVTGRAAVMLG